MLLALPAAASDFGTRYPDGSIRDTAQAQAALKDADAEMARIGQSAKSREADCYRGFFVNSCRDNVRREKELAEREVKRVQLEARDLQRRLDAEEVARRRAEDAAAGAAEDAQRPQKEEAARAASQAREAELKRRGTIATEDGVRDPGNQTPSSEQGRSPSQQDRLPAAERAENVRKFQQKQLQAEKRAEEKEAERKKNEQRRAEKRKQMEQREAEREAVRKRAAEAIK